MEKTEGNNTPVAIKDFARFWRIPEGNCELLSARYGTQTFGRHSHERYALGVISGGVEKLYYRGGYAVGGVGSVVTISPGEIHDGLPGHEDGWMYRMLYLDPEWVNRTVFQGRVAGDHVHLFENALTSDPALAQVFLQHHRFIEQAPPGLQRESTLLELVGQVFERSGATTPRALPSEQQAVSRIRKKLEEEFDQDIALQTLAQLVDLDPLYLIRVFKKHVGVSPHSYQIQIRVGRVQQLLRAGVSLAEAAFTCGFFDQSHMTRAFKKVVGITPGRFRTTL
ncbi:helix-turn-helix domain-containing protein [Pseudomonas putida]